VPRLLQWRDAEYRDGPALRAFRCTAEDAKAYYTPGAGDSLEHPALYEFKVQVLIQGIKPPLAKKYAVRLGEDADGIGGVSVWEEVRQGEHYELCFAALALRLRGRGLGHADEMLSDSLDGITSRCVDVEAAGPVTVAAIIDPENFNSKNLCTRVGFSYRGSDKVDPHFEYWERDLPIPMF
jgi:hypothetical protein